MTPPPIHPALVHLPIAFVILSVTADFCARRSKEESRRAVFRTLGFWSLVAAFAGGALSIAAGHLDLNRVVLLPETRELVKLHMISGWILGAALGILTAWRWLIWHRGQMTINTSYLVTGAAVLGLTLFQAWYGGEMVFSHGAGVALTGQGVETADAARERLIAVRNLLTTGPAIGGAEPPGGTLTETNRSQPPPAPGSTPRR